MAKKPPCERGIRIPLTARSWKLVSQALTYVVEKPHLDDLEEDREELGKILRYINSKLGEKGISNDDS